MNDITFNEYGNTMPSSIRDGMTPSCKQIAVIPSLTVENVTGLKGLANCFVHVSKNNTTYYIDDKHRTIITWAGPVEVDDYDADTNPLKLRSQVCYDFANDIAYYFNKTGGYKTITLGA